MARIVILLVAIHAAFYLEISALTAQEKNSKSALSLKLEAVNETIRAGSRPVLRFTIKNVSDADEKILKPRGDLQDTYYDLVVSKEGKEHSLPRAISDPGPVSD